MLRDFMTERRLEQLFELLRRSLTTPQTYTAAVTLNSSNTIVLCDATAAAFTVSLPPAVEHRTRQYSIKKIDASANAVTIDGFAAETIDGAATQALATQWKSKTIVSDGTQWLILSVV